MAHTRTDFAALGVVLGRIESSTPRALGAQAGHPSRKFSMFHHFRENNDGQNHPDPTRPVVGK